VIYLVSGSLVYCLLMFIHFMFSAGRPAKFYAAMHFLSVVIFLSLILTGAV
jgi:hypothetical protein